MNAADSEPVEQVGPAPEIEVRAAALPTLIPTIRAVASDLAARADFDLDAISDLRMAVDEACATLVEIAGPGSRLICRFDVRPDRIGVEVTIPLPADPPGTGPVIGTDTFGWRVLQTLADDVAVVRLPGDNAGSDRVGIRLDKRPIAEPR